MQRRLGGRADVDGRARTVRADERDAGSRAERLGRRVGGGERAERVLRVLAGLRVSARVQPNQLSQSIQHMDVQALPKGWDQARRATRAASPSERLCTARPSSRERVSGHNGTASTPACVDDIRRPAPHHKIVTRRKAAEVRQNDSAHAPCPTCDRGSACWRARWPTPRTR